MPHFSRHGPACPGHLSRHVLECPAGIPASSREDMTSCSADRTSPVRTKCTESGRRVTVQPQRNVLAQSAIPPSPWSSEVLVLPSVVKPACLTQDRTPQSPTAPRKADNRPRIPRQTASKPLTRSGVLSSCALRARPRPNIIERTKNITGRKPHEPEKMPRRPGLGCDSDRRGIGRRTRQNRPRAGLVRTFRGLRQADRAWRGTLSQDQRRHLRRPQGRVGHQG